MAIFSLKYMGDIFFLIFFTHIFLILLIYLGPKNTCAGPRIKIILLIYLGGGRQDCTEIDSFGVQGAMC